MQGTNPYQPPQAELSTSSVPVSFYLEGLSPRYFRIAAACTVLSMVLSIIDIALGLTESTEVTVQWDGSVFLTLLPAVLLACYAWLAFDRLLVHRVQHAGSTWIIRAIVVVSILSLAPAPFLAGAEELLSWPWLAFYAVVFAMGLLSVWLGVKLVRVPTQFSQLKLFAWSTLVSGVCYATIVLVVIGILVSFIANVALVMMFLHASAELAKGPDEAGSPTSIERKER